MSKMSVGDETSVPGHSRVCFKIRYCQAVLCLEQVLFQAFIHLKDSSLIQTILWCFGWRKHTTPEWASVNVGKKLELKPFLLDSSWGPDGGFYFVSSDKVLTFSIFFKQFWVNATMWSAEKWRELVKLWPADQKPTAFSHGGDVSA